MSALDRVHAPGRAARTPYYPTHRVRAGHTHSVRSVARGSQYTDRVHRVQVERAEICRLETARGDCTRWPQDQACYPAHCVQERVK